MKNYLIRARSNRSNDIHDVVLAILTDEKEAILAMELFMKARNEEARKKYGEDWVYHISSIVLDTVIVSNTAQEAIDAFKV